jgi:cobalt-zinc-cadmium efflux system membrane fusion protein
MRSLNCNTCREINSNQLKIFAMNIQQYIPSILTASLISLLLLSCGGSAEQQPGQAVEKTAAREEEVHGGELELSEAQLKAVGIEIGKIEQKNLDAVVKASGQLAVPPQNKAEVNVLMGGVVRKINVLEGQSVSKGQVLVVIENPDFVKMQQDYLTTRNSFAFTQDELKRQQELMEANAGTGKNLQQVRANYNAEKAKILTLEKQLQQLGISPAAAVNGNIATQVAVPAPISGTVGHIAVNTGTYAATSKPLMEIIDNSQIHCDLVVYEKDLFKVKTGQKVHFTLTNQNNRQIQGEIYGVNKSFEDDSKGIIVHAVIRDAASSHLIPGMYVTALIDIGNHLTAAVPADAIVRSEGKDYIFAVDSVHQQEGKHFSFRKVEVITGVAELGYVQISVLGELAPDVPVITKGAFYLLSKEKASGHDDE